MKTALLDTNCLIDLDEDGEAAPALHRIVGEHRAGGLRLVVAATTASENPRKGSPPKTWPQFTDLLGRVGLAEVEILKPMAYWDVTFWGRGALGGRGHGRPRVAGPRRPLPFPRDGRPLRRAKMAKREVRRSGGLDGDVEPGRRTCDRRPEDRRSRERVDSDQTDRGPCAGNVRASPQ